nr:zinc ribbon domain-containing protein [Mesorhizobium sp. YR577]
MEPHSRFNSNCRIQGGIKSGRGGRALLAGLLTCGRCGRRLGVVYSGRPPGHPYYRCERINQMLAKPRCMTFGASRIDPAIGKEILTAVTHKAASTFWSDTFSRTL